MLNLLKTLLTFAAASVLLGCMTIPPAVPADPARLREGISLERALPDPLPDNAVPVPHAQIVWLPGESAAGLLMPIPFVAEAISGAMNRDTANALESKLASIHPFQIAQEAMRGSPLYRASGGAVKVKPFAFMQECADDRTRVALVFHASAGSWTGRYMAHLPTTYSASETTRPTPAVLSRLSDELRVAASQLRSVLERAARGELQQALGKADVGSLHLVCSKSAGLLSPTLLVARGAELIEETPDTILVRMAGDTSKAASLGGLFFGVHLLRKDQLHTFKPQAAK